MRGMSGGIFILCAAVGVSVCVTLFLSPVLTSAPSTTEVSIGNISAKSNEIVVTKIMIKNVNTPGVSAVTINLTYNPSVVNVISVNNISFGSLVANIQNSSCYTKIVAYQTEAVGLTGDVKFAEIGFKAAGKEGEVSPLNIEVITLKDNVGIPISYEVKNGSFTIAGYAQFDTDSPENPYPSIAGIHNGTIKPNETIVVHKLYTYPCAGTGGHSEVIRIWNNSGWNASARWEGYRGDWHNITFEESFKLQPDVEYNYTIETGSYPQIIHAKNFNTSAGKIACDEFIDANGKRYVDWIPAIRLV